MPSRCHWRAEPASYAYRGERRLSEADIATLSAWVKAGMPEGAGKAPEPPQFPSGWQLGEPDLVVEIVSPSSVEKDTKLLRKLYWAAGIQEYWLLELTEADVHFTLLQRGSKSYVATRPRDGWVKSDVFGLALRLTRATDQHGLFRFLTEG